MRFTFTIRISFIFRFISGGAVFLQNSFTRFGAVIFIGPQPGGIASFDSSTAR